MWRYHDFGKCTRYREAMASLAPRILSGELKVTPTVKRLISAEALRECLGIIKANGQKAEALFMNARDYADVRRSCRDSLDTWSGGAHWSPHCAIEGAAIFTARIVPRGKAWFLAEGCLDSVYEMLIPFDTPPLPGGELV